MAVGADQPEDCADSSILEQLKVKCLVCSIVIASGQKGFGLCVVG